MSASLPSDCFKSREWHSMGLMAGPQLDSGVTLGSHRQKHLTPEPQYPFSSGSLVFAKQGHWRFYNVPLWIPAQGLGKTVASIHGTCGYGQGTWLDEAD